MKTLNGKVNGARVLVLWEEASKNKKSRIITDKDKYQRNGIIAAVGEQVKNKELKPGLQIFWPGDQITTMSMRVTEIDGVEYLVVAEELIVFYREAETDEAVVVEGQV